MSAVNDLPPPRLGPWDSVGELLADVQRLADTQRPPEGFPLEWQVEAAFLGDAPALAATAIRFTND